MPEKTSVLLLIYPAKHCNQSQKLQVFLYQKHCEDVPVDGMTRETGLADKHILGSSRNR